MIKPQIPKGFRDFLPQKMILRKKIIDTMTAVFETFGFEPLDTPCLEYAETLMGKYGEEGDRLIYRFEDRGGRNVALRYDLTIPLSRVVAMYNDITKPFKRYQIAPVWRADKPQKGRFREFYQCDIDIIGSSSAYAEGELLVMTHTVLQKLGFDSYVIRINNRKVLNALAQKIGLEENHIPAFLRSLDKLDKIGAEAVVREMKENIPLDAASEEIISRDILAGNTSFETIADMVRGIPLGDEGLRELDMICESLAANDVPEKYYSLDIALARGLDYYTGPIFETVVKEPRIGSITGGGRYDSLIGLFTKNSLPATGTSFGLERIVTVMDELGMQKQRTTQTQVLITLFDADLMPVNMQTANMLREAGINTEIYFAADKLKKQMSYAANRGFPFVLIIGPDEARDGNVTLKNMDTGEQESISRSVLVETIKSKLA